MKIKLIYSTMLALAVALASTGCKHKPERVTPIPGPIGSNVSDNNQPTTIPYPGNQGITSTGVPETTAFDPNKFNQDRSALASYTIHFPYDSAAIKDNEKANIQSVAQALQQDRSAQLLIEGHCDERGTEEYNRSLGERRAEAAREALVAAGIDQNRLHTISYGKDKPADASHNESAWSKNRRDEFVLLHPKTGM